MVGCVGGRRVHGCRGEQPPKRTPPPSDIMGINFSWWIAIETGYPVVKFRSCASDPLFAPVQPRTTNHWHNTGSDNEIMPVRWPNWSIRFVCGLFCRWFERQLKWGAALNQFENLHFALYMGVSSVIDFFLFRVPWSSVLYNAVLIRSTTSFLVRQVTNHFKR